MSFPFDIPFTDVAGPVDEPPIWLNWYGWGREVDANVLSLKGLIDTLETLTGDGTSGNAALNTRLGTIETLTSDGTSGNAALAGRATALETLTADAQTGNAALDTRATALEEATQDETSGNAALAGRATALETITSDEQTGNAALAAGIDAVSAEISYVTSDLIEVEEGEDVPQVLIEGADGLSVPIGAAGGGAGGVSAYRDLIDGDGLSGDVPSVIYEFDDGTEYAFIPTGLSLADPAHARNGSPEASPASADYDLDRITWPARGHLGASGRKLLTLLIGWGQSLDQGPSDIVSGSATFPLSVLMSNDGVLNPSATSSLVPAVSEAVASSGETGLVAAANRLTSLVSVNTGFNPLIGIACFAAGGTSIYDLGPGSDRWSKLEKFLSDVRAIAELQGWDVEAHLITTHGNEDAGNDVTAGRYAAQLIQYHGQLWAVCRMVLDQQRPPVWFHAQCDVGDTSAMTEVGVRQGIVEASRLSPYIVPLSAHYDLPRTDGTHISGSDTVVMKERDAEQITRHLSGIARPSYRVRDARWLSPTEILLRYHVPVEPLVLDAGTYITQSFATNVEGGIEFDDGSDAKADSLSVVGSDGVKITLSEPSRGASPRVMIAMRRQSGDGPVTGARCNIRDSAAALSSQSARPLINWALAETVVLPPAPLPDFDAVSDDGKALMISSGAPAWVTP